MCKGALTHSPAPTTGFTSLGLFPQQQNVDDDNTKATFMRHLLYADRFLDA